MVAKLVDDKTFLFIKFKDNKEHLLSLQEGMLYMNNGKYFKDLENDTGILGIGDKYELSQVINEISFRLINSETQETIFVGDAAAASFSLNAHLAMPMFCLTQIDSTSLKIIKEYEDSVDCVVNLGEDDIEKIIKDFGEYALVISPGAFEEKLEMAINEQGLYAYAGKVIYEDYGINSSKRLKASYDNDPKHFFYKRMELAHQKEYRVILPDTQSEGPFILNIGDLSDSSYLFETRELFSGNFILNLSLK